MSQALQLFPVETRDKQPRFGTRGEANRLLARDRPAHDWYRFVLSFPPHLVRDYLERFEIQPGHTVLDPFCGTGTTLVECKKLGIRSVGIEAHPMAYFASRVKVDWTPDPKGLLEHAEQVAETAINILANQGISDRVIDHTDANVLNSLRRLPDETAKLLLRGSISPLPLHKVLVLLDCLTAAQDERYSGHERLALAKALVSTIGNLHFGPEVGVTKPKSDVSVVGTWLAIVREMADDLRQLCEMADTPSVVHCADSRSVSEVVQRGSIDVVITSPPYPNEKDYTRTTRLESVLLGFIRNKEQLRELKRQLIRSNTRTVYKGDDDDQWVAGHSEIQKLADEIETRRIQLGKTSGFERLYPKVTKLYFGGMARHLQQLKSVLRPGARLAYVVGDQASYLRVVIRTAQLLGEIATSLGYELISIDLFRTRMATATMDEMREEVLVLRWPGEGKTLWGGVGLAKKDQPSGDDVYGQVIEWIFHSKYRSGDTSIIWERSDIETACIALKLERPKNLGDVVYSFRFRRPLPESINKVAPPGKEWVIRLAGDGKYKFELASLAWVKPNPGLAETKIPEATPGIITKYALGDEQALLAKIRYNRLLDIFTGLTCYSLQSHLRTNVSGIGQVETDEVYVGIDKKGTHYVLPVQAKGSSDYISVVQVEQDLAMCSAKFPGLICRPVSAQFINDDLIALFEFEVQNSELKIVSERHYRLVPPDDISDADLQAYKQRTT